MASSLRAAAHKSVQVGAGLQGTLRSFVSHAPETTQVWALRSRACSRGERKAGSSLLSVKCPFVIPGTWVPGGHNQDRLCCSLLPLCGQQVSWLTWTLILSTGWKRFPRGNWSSWKRWLSWKRGRSGQARRKGNRHLLFLLLIVISSPCTVLFTLVFIILHFITKFLFKWKSRH